MAENGIQEVCKRCRTPVSPNAQFCERCGAPLRGQRSPPSPHEEPSKPLSHNGAPPGQPLGYPMYQAPPPYAPAPSTPYEGVPIRFVAILIDSIILGVVSGIVAGIIGALRWAPRGLIFLFFLVFAFLYFTWMEGTYGQTVGKIAVQIKVVKEDGSPIDYGDAAVRTILRIIDGIFLYFIGAILIWSSDKRQRLGDMVAHTVVVKA
jgi:uncharacterized RDD family membrane protein YckC